MSRYGEVARRRASYAVLRVPGKGRAGSGRVCVAGFGFPSQVKSTLSVRSGRLQ